MQRAWTLLRGLLALLVLVVLVVGLPVALFAVGGSPIPAALPDLEQVWETLTTRDDGTVLLGLLRLAAWLGWAVFTLSVLADVVARVRGVRIPRLGPQQALASQLVATVAAMSLLAPAAASAVPLQAAAVAVLQEVTSRETAGSATTAGAGASERLAAAEGLAAAQRRAAADPSETGLRSARHAAERSWEQAHWVDGAMRAGGVENSDAADQHWTDYRVRPGDTLWDVADDQLGDPFRWPEIYAATLTVAQPDGRRIEDPDLIRPGWTLRIPHESPPASKRTAGSRPPAASPREPGERSHPDIPSSEATAGESQTEGRTFGLETPLTGGAAVGPVPGGVDESEPVTPLSAPGRFAGPTDADAVPMAAGAVDDWRRYLRSTVPELD